MEENIVEYAMVTVTYDITEDLVKVKIPFFGASDIPGIVAVFVDGRPKAKLPKTVSFTKPGVHVVKIALEDSTLIPKYFLDGATNIQCIEIPDSVTVIMDHAFDRVESKQRPVLPSALKEVKWRAFAEVYNDADVLQLPESLESIGGYAFTGVGELVVGKCFKGDVSYLLEKEKCYKKVTVSEDNIYYKVCDGFVINRETGVLEGVLSGAYEDTPETILRIPEEVTVFADSEMFRPFKHASIEVHGNVEKCRICYLGGPDTHKISLAPGVKACTISGRYEGPAKVTLSIPPTVKDFCLWRIISDSLTIPENSAINMSKCCISKLMIGSGVIAGNGYESGNRDVFRAFKGEIFFAGTVEIEEFGYMDDETVIHVQDYETGLRILESPGFNRKVKIFVGDDQPLMEQADEEQKLFQLLGCPGYSKKLLPLELSDKRLPSCVTLMFDFPEQTTLNIRHSASALIIDDGKPKKQRKRCTDEPLVSKEFEMPEGQHIVRLLNQQLSGFEDVLLSLEPACETMLINDVTSMTGTLDKLKGIKHIILGAMCNVKEIGSPVERVSVVPQNKWLEMVDGCLVSKDTKTLVFAPVGTTSLPQGIKSIEKNALINYTHDRLVIPSSAKQICLSNLTGGIANLKELVFEEGIEDISIENITFLPDIKIIFPSTLKRINMCNVSVDRVEIPVACELDKFRRSKINSLTFSGDVELRPSPVTERDYSSWPYKSYTVNYNTFDDFVGNITFCGKVNLHEGFGHMHDGSLIHVHDKDTGLTVFESQGFNKKVKIFIGGDQPLEAQADEEQKLFQLLGCPGYSKKLLPLEPDSNKRRPGCVTLMFDFSDNTLLHMRCEADAMMIDDGEQVYPRSKIAMSKGQHIVRLIKPALYRDKEVPAFYPACETMLIDDAMSVDGISQSLMGVKHLILGAKCNIEKITCPVKKVSVVPENNWLEMVDGCLVRKDTKSLLFVPAGITTLPQGIKSIQNLALSNYTHDRLVIPSSVKKVILDEIMLACASLKELVFEEGVEDITINDITFLPNARITFPSTLKRICMIGVSVDRIEIPAACEIDRFRCSRINNLIFAGDVELSPISYSQKVNGKNTTVYYDTFGYFSGNITFCGKVCPRLALESDDEQGSFLGKMNDDCTITVADQATCDLIKSANDYNGNVTITVAEKRPTDNQ